MTACQLDLSRTAPSQTCNVHSIIHSTDTGAVRPAGATWPVFPGHRLRTRRLRSWARGGDDHARHGRSSGTRCAFVGTGRVTVNASSLAAHGRCLHHLLMPQAQRRAAGAGCRVGCRCGVAPPAIPTSWIPLAYRSACSPLGQSHASDLQASPQLHICSATPGNLYCSCAVHDRPSRGVDGPSGSQSSS
jgi:hypothetical protein